jgi:hypothetical protein
LPSGLVGGLAGAVVMAILITLMNPPTLAAAIPGLYGLSEMAAGWAVHLFHGAVLGVVFAGIVEVGFEDAGRSTVMGLALAWGVLTWIVLAALVMPVWLGAVGFPKTPPLPNFAVPSLLWHLVYGAVLGVVFPALR